MIVEYLKNNGKQRFAGLWKEFGQDFGTHEALHQFIAALVSAGCVRKRPGNTVFYSYDEDFTCGFCRSSWPDVKRYGNTRNCRDCYRVLYRESREASRQKKKAGDEGEPNTPVSRFVTGDVDACWDGARCQELLSRPLV